MFVLANGIAKCGCFRGDSNNMETSVHFLLLQMLLQMLSIHLCLDLMIVSLLPRESDSGLSLPHSTLEADRTTCRYSINY